MDARSAAALLGGTARGNRVSCPGPNHSDKDRSLTVVFTPDGFVVHSFSNDDWQECKDYVRAHLGLPSEWKPDPEKFRYPENDDDRNFEFAMQLWAQSKSIRGTLAERYLASRSINLDDDIECIRFHPSLKMNGSRAPALVSLYQDILTNEPRGIQRTFLSDDARKIDRWMLGSATGAAIKIDDDADVTASITVGEGLETCLSAREMGYRPVWALMSANGIRDFEPLPAIEAITYLGERNDHARKNEMSIKASARKWIIAGREAFAFFPKSGNDMNDIAGNYIK